MSSTKMNAIVVLLFLVIFNFEMCILQKPNVDARRHDVYIAGFFPFGKGVENSETGRGVMPSVKLALDHVNEHSQILRNYRLHMWWNDTMCNAAVGVKAFFDMMHSGPHKLMLFGAACTHVTDPIAKASKHWHLTQLSYADTHPMFTKENFPNFFRIVPSDNAFNSPRLSLLKEFNWTRVGTIYQNEPRYSLAHNRLVAELDMLGYQVVETQSFTNDCTALISALTKLKEKDTRVILGNFNEKWAKQMFCEAYRLDMYGRKYQWLIMGTYRFEWWKKFDEDVNCTLDELETSLEQTILTDLLPLSTSGEITISGITADEYKVEYDSRRGKEYSRFHGYTYDGIWAVALAIQNVAHKIKYYRRNQTVTDFRYRDPLWERLFLDALNNTSFEGVTGPVRFYDNERKASILLKQFQNGQEVKVGEYSAAIQHLDLTLGVPLKWTGKYPPKDRTVLIIEHTRVNKTVYAILASLAIIGIFIAAFFLAFNIKYRNQRYIKMSSPQLNNLIIIGCMITYTSIIFLGLDSGLSSIEAFPYICTARAWTLMAGFSLAFGSMFSKTWRVHSIFTDVKLNKKVIKDYQLFMVVGVLLCVDVVIMTTWQIADPFYRETKRGEPYPHPSNEDEIIIPENEYCTSNKMTIFISSIYVYKGLLMIFGAFLAWETRHVSIPALNDSRYVGFSVYNVVIMCILGAAVALALVDHQDEMFLLISSFIMFCTTITLCLVFVPKMVELRKDPGGSIDNRIRATLRPMSKTRRDSSVSEIETKMKDLKELNTKYKKTLLDRESELQMLIRQLGNEANEILEDQKTEDSISETNRLSVPLLRKELPSATETSDLTSLCSLSSQPDYNSLHRSESQKKRKHPPPTDTSPKKTQNSPKSKKPEDDLYHQQKPPNQPKPKQPIAQPIQQQLNGTLNKPNPPKVDTIPLKLDNNYNSVKEPNKVVSIAEQIEIQRCETQLKPFPSEQVESRDSTLKRQERKTPTHERRLSRTPGVVDSIEVQEKRRSSIKTPGNITEQEVSCHRRTSTQSNNRGTPKKKPECGTHVVAKSELWDTGSQHRCQKSHQKTNRVSIPQQDEDDPHIHRSTSERNRHGSQKEKREKSPAKSTPPPPPEVSGCNIGNAQCQKLGYFTSTPNVAAALKSSTHPPKRDKSMYNATSEGELLDREILPIFQKLLTERNKSQQNIDYSFGRSCPNISIKCDIVEYL
ncbi:gamma-aminobutyric acid type B receptor subunit 2 isoform X2 [Anthonomus grandis grandis]|uniref:gamma-aminobutyric acid type B receptor subunit 2 isoform X2 n=1 Tax=Anthonomus grandis grandis TaxID=2921223 RepID=UPI0021656879|nr:gamma-aminobutyric acid type B receptor subunit 2 isoform X2 [Anthonomus grandis grandis]